ncbi:AbrB/MazE/SpoVT family DNA-binding domain-containing protein [Bosea caraganae]|uniref:AbrB/MazE/SpoVT family DNA-binding domain-containing protein n=1 Tax=Bosea caraganae TaxID=2763117 RepID=A0A370L3I7_9HYPH|nr:AbrB/MazE/SpoVT family DNA-binding domain-containing protein [Bosea caraganae]RDJ22961.1 AbrB/MazE/SpoVT family DNA-binding domain-containing protein [Bosea caraganae]RDJ28741.1 AbrB/MazE/SpoVT family DNA-binding domain-containing protein [Bosea caraganae]
MIKAASTLTSKGQFTLPVEIRQALDLRPGDELRFELSDDKTLTVAPRRRRSIRELRETVPPLTLGRPLTQADIEDAITEEMNAQEERVRLAR